MKKDRNPTVIIGSGLAGLFCGALLSDAGFPVTILEKSKIPGGFCSCFRRKNHRFGISAGILNNNYPSHVFKNLDIRLNLIDIPELYRHKTPDYDISIPQSDPDGYVDLLADIFGEKDGIAGYISEIASIAEKLSESKGPIAQKNLLKLGRKTLDQHISEYVSEPALKNILTSLWGGCGLPPAKLPAYRYAIVAGNSLKYGTKYVDPQHISNSLAEKIHEKGGKILFRSKVEKIIVKDGAVQGVVVNGQKIKAKVVVSNISAIKTLDMLPHTPIFKKNMANFRPSISAFLVWLGLRQRLDLRGYNIQAVSGFGPESDYDSFITGDAGKGSFSVYNYGYLSKENKTLMIILLTGYEPWQRFENDYMRGEKEKYHKEKDRWADIIIQKTEERLIPGLSKMIDVKVSATPLTILRYTGHTNGAIHGFEPPIRGFANPDNRTPINGLYLTGAWSRPGHGYAGVLRSGEMTFQKILLLTN